MREITENRANMAEFLSGVMKRRRERNIPCSKDLEEVQG